MVTPKYRKRLGGWPRGKGVDRVQMIMWPFPFKTGRSFWILSVGLPSRVSAVAGRVVAVSESRIRRLWFKMRRQRFNQNLRGKFFTERLMVIYGISCQRRWLRQVL